MLTVFTRPSSNGNRLRTEPTTKDLPPLQGRREARGTRLFSPLPRNRLWFLLTSVFSMSILQHNRALHWGAQSGRGRRGVIQVWLPLRSADQRCWNFLRVLDHSNLFYHANLFCGHRTERGEALTFTPPESAPSDQFWGIYALIGGVRVKGVYPMESSLCA